MTVTLATVLAGILFNRSDLQSLRIELKGDIKELRNEMNSRVDRVDGEIRCLHGVTRKLDGRVEALNVRCLRHLLLL